MAESKETKGLSELKLGGLPVHLAIAAILLCGLTMYLGVQSSSMTGTLASCFALAVVLNEIGERIPIWNTYIGGGLLLVFFGVALMKYFNILPADTVANVNSFIIGDEINFLEFFIVCLIVGSVLALDRDILLRSFAGYLPAILGGLLVAGFLGIVTGLIFGIRPADSLIKYVLPIMGGGNGAGAAPWFPFFLWTKSITYDIMHLIISIK